MMNRQSKGAQQATFMIIENLECDQWHTSIIDGKDNQNQPGYHTTWAYEFVTTLQKLNCMLKCQQALTCMKLGFT